MEHLTIYGNTPSKKNAKAIFRPNSQNSKKKLRIVPGNLYRKWHAVQIKTLKYCKDISYIKGIMKYPVTILMAFYRDTSRKFDYTNVMESIMDLLVDVNILVDYNVKRARPIPVGYAVDREHPRAEVYIFNHGEEWMEKFKKIEGEVD